MRGGRECGIGNAECGRWKKRRLEDGKMRRWGKSRTEAFDCGLWIAGKKEVGKLGR